MTEAGTGRPTFTLLMGASGVGKTSWARANRNLLPERFYDERSLAEGVGDWNRDGAQDRARLIVDAGIDEALRLGLDFGMETRDTRPPPHPPSRARQRAVAAGYRIRGIFIGTGACATYKRLKRRKRQNTGHSVSLSEVKRWRWRSFGRLLKSAGQFDPLLLLDNTRKQDLPLADLPPQCELVRGRLVWRAGDIAPWCGKWLVRLGRQQGRLEGKLAA